LKGVVHCLALDAHPAAATTAATLDADRDHALMGLIRMVQGLPEQGAASPSVWIVTRGAAPVESAGAPIHAAAAMLWGAGRGLALERPDLWGGLLDLDPAGDRDEAARIVDELQDPDGEDQVAWRGRRRFVPRLVAAGGMTRAPLRVAPDRTYLVTGGLGQIAGRFIRLLVERGARHLLLVGRRGAATPEALARVQSLRDAGVEVRVLEADVAREADLRRIEEALDSGAPLGGVIHAAGVARFERIAALEPDAVRAALEARVRGTWALHELTRTRPVDLFVCAASIASVWGSVGQLHYAAANQFEDAVAWLRRQQGLPGTSVSFSPWQGGGVLSEEFARFMASLGVAPVATDEGMRALEAALASGRAHVVLAKVEWGLFRSVMEARRRRPLFEELAVAAAAPADAGRAAGGDLRDELAAAPASERRELLVTHVQGQMAELMGFGAERPEPRRGFIELGVDSLMAVTLRDRLQSSLGIELPVTFIFDHPTVEALADHLLGNVLVTETRAAPAAAPAPPAGRDALVDEVRELSQDELESAIARQLRELGLH
jgi:NADP-dependent 3-hydroxy acid dehydrogenase YdfG/acyl carrier protein